MSEIELPDHEKFKFELKKGQSKNKYAHKCVGRLVLALSVLGGSSIGVISNVLQPAGPFLLNAWRFQALIFVTIFMIPFFYMYDRCYLKYERYRAFVRQLVEKQKERRLLKKKDEDHEKFATAVPTSDPNVVRSYEDKYPRLSGFTEDERKGSEHDSGSMEFDDMLKDRRIFDDFSKSDKHGFRKTMSENLKSFNTSAHSL